MTRKPRAPDTPAERRLGDDESALWDEVMADVERLPKAKRPPAAGASAVAKSPPPMRSRPRPMPVAPPARPAPEPPLEHGAAPGLDKRARLRLRRGQVEIQGVIDLHGLTQTEAHRALTGFLEGARAADKRTLLVITGKGAGRGSGVLRAAVPRWLNEPHLRRMIVAFSYAAPKDGGDGALYVLLKRKR